MNRAGGLSVLLCAACALPTGAGAATFESLHTKFVRTAVAHDFWQLARIEDAAVGFVHTVITRGTTGGAAVLVVRREGAMFIPQRGVAKLDETTYWDMDVKPLAASLTETIGDATRRCTAEFVEGAVVVRESAAGGAPRETRVAIPGPLVPEEDVYPLLYDASKEGERTCHVFDLQSASVKKILLNVRGIYELDYGDGSKKPGLRIDSDSDGGVVHYFVPDTGAFIQSSYEAAKLTILASTPEAPKAFYASTILTRDLVARARAGWKQTGSTHANDILGIAFGLSSEWKSGTLADDDVMRMEHGTHGSVFRFIVEHVGEVWTLEECARIHGDSLKANKAIAIQNSARTTLMSKAAYRFQYTVGVEGQTIPVLCYVILHKGATLKLTWVLEPGKKALAEADMAATIRTIKFTK